MTSVLAYFLGALFILFLSTLFPAGQGFSGVNEVASQGAALDRQARRVALNLAQYHQAAALWAMAHPGQYGAVPPASLALPPGTDAPTLAGLTSVYLSGIGVCTYQSAAAVAVSGQTVAGEIDALMGLASWFTGWVQNGVYQTESINLGAVGGMANPCITVGGVPNDSEIRAVRFTPLP